MTLAPKSAIIHYAGAQVYLCTDDLDRALTIFKELYEMSPGYLGVECNIGEILEKQYKWTEAEKYYSDLLQSGYYINNSNQMELYSKLFDFYLKINNIDKAVKINKLLEELDDKLLEPISIKVKYINLGMNYFHLNQPFFKRLIC